MIYLIADPHGGESMAGLEAFLRQAEKEDLLIILGDLGLQFENTKENKAFTEWFLSLDYQIALVEGNHENHPFLNRFPEEMWCGGRVNRLTEKIVRLQRGNLFVIENKTFFVMGGCKSSEKWKEMGLWYPGEEPNAEELRLGYETLAACHHRVDYILTHKYDVEQLKELAEDPLSLLGLQRYLDRNVSFAHWYSGHWHRAFSVDEKHTVVYDNPVRIG